MKRMACLLTVVLAIAGCSRESNGIKSAFDTGKGEWTNEGDGTFQYKISAKAKDGLLLAEKSKRETSRNEVLLLAIAYIADIDPEFSSLGNNSAQINMQNNAVEIGANGKRYRVTFERYKGSYFPTLVETLR